MEPREPPALRLYEDPRPIAQMLPNKLGELYFPQETYPLRVLSGLVGEVEEGGRGADLSDKL